MRRGGKRRKGREKGEGGREEEEKKSREGEGGDKSPAWSSQNLGSTAFSTA